MQIRLLDHLIIGDDCFSFADEGIMAEIGAWCTSVCQTNENSALL
jgi:DNA repair protein RadC